MKIKTVHTEIFQKELETRGSHPSIFDCSDSNRYIVKHSQQKRNYKHLINELISAQLGKAIKLSIPNFALVEIKDTIIPNDYSFSLGNPSGLGFGSKYLSGTVKTITSIDTIIGLSKLKNDKLIEDLIKIIVFDVWLRNNDRSINNPNLILQESGKNIRLYAIDHSSIFSELNYLSLKKEINSLPPIGDNLVDKELFSYLYFNYGLFFNKIKIDIYKSISILSEDTILQILESIPVQWKIDSKEKLEIFNFINKRKILIEDQFNSLLKEIGL